jgi:hypothetical protein
MPAMAAGGMEASATAAEAIGEMKGPFALNGPYGKSLQDVLG